VEFLGRKTGKSFAKVEARLGAENGVGTGAGAVVAKLALVENVL
jgi:hypothetical protein